jgi:hypothetical protein
MTTVKPQQLPWEDWREGEDAHLGWMRATAPGGAAEFEGIVAWSAELGYGVRVPRGPTAEEAAIAAHAGPGRGRTTTDHDGGHH